MGVLALWDATNELLKIRYHTTWLSCDSLLKTRDRVYLTALLLNGPTKKALAKELKILSQWMRSKFCRVSASSFPLFDTDARERSCKRHETFNTSKQNRRMFCITDSSFHRQLRIIVKNIQ